MNKLFLYAAFAALFFFMGCTRTDDVSWEQPRQNSVTIKGKTFPVEDLLYETVEMEYLDGKENLVALRVMCTGAGLSVDLPVRLLGTKIDLTARDTSPDTGGLYYTFFLSERATEEGEYGDWLYCAIRSWVVSSDRRSAYGGWFTIYRGEEAGEWVLEWELTSNSDGEVVSTGYIDSIFEPIE